MKKFMPLLVVGVLSAVPVFAAGVQAPIAEDVLGCFYRVEHKPDQRGVPARFKTVFVFRSGEKVSDPFGQSDMNGKMAAVTIERSYSQWGVNRSGLTYGEGTTELVVPPSESSWTYPAPKGTVYTVRGNFVGFFLSRNENGVPAGLLARPQWSGSVDTLECTNNEADLLKWCAIAKEDARSVDAFGLTKWCD